MLTHGSEAPARRRFLPGSALVLLVSLCAVPPSAAQGLDRSTYAVDEGILTEGCGGFEGGCREYALRGTLDLVLDREAGTAAIPEAGLEVSREDGAFAIDPPLADLVGTFDGRTARFATPPGFPQSVDWEMTLTDRGLVLQGVYDQGCCDLHAFTFRNVSFGRESRASTRLMLAQRRFAVEARWADFAGRRGQGRAVELNAGSGSFWFFSPDNTELVVKVLDACDAFDRFWFFAAGLTNVEVEITVTDLASGVERHYRNPLGQSFQPILDTNAFATCGAGPSPAP